MSIKNKLLALLSACAIALPLAGCNNNNTTGTIGKIKDTDINAGIYLFYTIQGYNDAFTKLSEKDASTTENNIWDKKIDDKSVNDYVTDYATNYCKTIISTEDKFEELGLKLDKDDEKALDNQLRDEWDKYGKTYTKNGISKNSIKQIITTNYKQDLIFKHYYFENGTKPVSEKEILDEINKSYARVKILPLTTLDEKYEPLDAIKKGEVLKQAEDYVAKVKSGEDFDEMIDDFYEKKYGSPASSSSDTDSKEEPKANRNEIVIYEGYQYIEDACVKEMIKLPVSNEAQIVKGEKNYYVVVKLDIAEDKDTIKTLHDGMIYKLKKDEFNKEALSWGDNLTMERNEESYSRYVPKDVIKKVLKNKTNSSTAN